MRGCTSVRMSVLALLLAAIGAGDVAAHPIYAPSWAGDPGATRALYTFQDASLNPDPIEYENALAMPDAEITLGQFGSGWQDPGDPLATTREPSSGAWDLGRNGTIAIFVPIGTATSTPGFPGYDVTVFVHIIAAYMMPPVDLPAVTLSGYTASNVQQVDALYSSSPATFWYTRTWSAETQPVMEDSLQLRITAGANGALVDAVDVYVLTQIIPEPSPWILMVPFLGWGLRVARRRRGLTGETIG